MNNSYYLASGHVREVKPRPIHVGKATAQLLQCIQLGSGAFSERWLQGLLHRYPECLPVPEIEPGFGELVSMGMEIPTAHGPVDNVFLTPDGQIVMVEAKLWQNPQARREVVAQALDYASCLFEWDYEAFERAILKGNFGASPMPQRIYDLFADKDPLPHAAFVDAVNTNLRKGRVLILVAGDGIRTETKRLAGMLQSHAGAHFTFALVELNVFALQEAEFLVVPRILAQTEMISRGVVEFSDARAKIILPYSLAVTAEKASFAAKWRGENITADEFYEAMASIAPDLPQHLRTFLEKLEPLGVIPDFQRSMNLRWSPPSGKSINLGTVQRDGQVWTDAVNARAPQTIGHAYIEDLAASFGMEVEKEAFSRNAWHVRIGGRAPRITDLSGKLDIWVEVIERFISAMRLHIASEEA